MQFYNWFRSIKSWTNFDGSHSLCEQLLNKHLCLARKIEAELEPLNETCVFRQQSFQSLIRDKPVWKSDEFGRGEGRGVSFCLLDFFPTPSLLCRHFFYINWHEYLSCTIYMCYPNPQSVFEWFVPGLAHALRSTNKHHTTIDFLCFNTSRF